MVTRNDSEELRKKSQSFFAKYTEQTIAPKTLLFMSEDESDVVYKLDSGRIIQYDVSPNGSRVVVNVFQPPAFLPMSRVLGVVDSYLFETYEECVVRKVPADEVLDFVTKNPGVLLDLVSRVYRGVGGLQRKFVYLASGTAMQRVICELVIWSSRFGTVQGDGSTILFVTEGELAANTGLARETVNREIANLKKRGLVQLQGRKMIIGQLDKLEAELGRL